MPFTSGAAAVYPVSARTQFSHSNSAIRENSRFVVSHERQPQRHALGGNEQVVAANWLAFLFEIRPNSSVNSFDGRLNRQDLNGLEDRLELRRQPLRCPLCSAIPEFCRHNDARAYGSLTDFSDAARGKALRIANEVGYDIRIEQIAHLQLHIVDRQFGNGREIIIDRRKRC
jgi:hypothetical protein